MCTRSQIAIAVISKEKAIFDQVKQNFMQSEFYKSNTDTAEKLLNLFQEKQKNSYHLIVIYEDSIKWYGDIDLAWDIFSEICSSFNLQWSFMRIGEDDYDDIEEENNYYRFDDHSDLLLPYEVFSFIRYIRSFV
ncbi:MAG: hypothetical protein Q8L78_05490 [Coxiellaceae bacterium]|nr:hypothetical protein [Coxiellaceae bacterium]